MLGTRWRPVARVNARDEERRGRLAERSHHHGTWNVAACLRTASCVPRRSCSSEPTRLCRRHCRRMSCPGGRPPPSVVSFGRAGVDASITLGPSAATLGPENERLVLLKGASVPDRRGRYFRRPLSGSRSELTSLSMARVSPEVRGRYFRNHQGVPETSPRYFRNPLAVPEARGRYFLQPFGVQKVSTSEFAGHGQSREAQCW